VAKILSEKLKIPLLENSSQAKNKNILLLDIVCNISKLEEMAKELKQNQAKEVFGLVVAKH